VRNYRRNASSLGSLLFAEVLLEAGKDLADLLRLTEVSHRIGY
jgi:hypothetical protein